MIAGLSPSTSRFSTRRGRSDVLRQLIYRVMVPALAPAYLTAALFRFRLHGQLPGLDLLTDARSKTLPIKMLQYIEESPTPQRGLLNADSLSRRWRFCSLLTGRLACTVWPAGGVKSNGVWWVRGISAVWPGETKGGMAERSARRGCPSSSISKRRGIAISDGDDTNEPYTR